MKKSLRILALILAIAMVACLFTGCAKNNTKNNAANQTGNNETEGQNDGEDADETEDTTNRQSEVPLVVGYSPFSEKFSPFFSETAYDTDVVSMTSVNLLTTDRTGGIIYKAIEGETVAYNGTDYTYTGIADLTVDYDEDADLTTYTWKLKDGVKFSDGEPLTADDVIFSYYVYCDPTYSGASTIYSVPIVGLQNYRTQTSDEVYQKYSDMADTIIAAGKDAAADEYATWFWGTALKDAWTAECQYIVDYCLANYLTSYAEAFGHTAEEINASDALKIAFGMYMWGFADLADGVMTGGTTGNTWNEADTTMQTFYDESYAKYNGDYDAFYGTETTGAEAADVITAAKDEFIGYWGPQDESMGGKGIPTITGIEKVDDLTVKITVNGFDATAVYSLGIQVSPLHYYGDASLYNYDNNQFGFPYGDLSSVTAKTTTPMGAGPYKFVKYENKVVYFEANENFYKGEPITTYVQFKETADADKISGVGAGTIDITDPSFGTAQADEIKTYNSNGELVGDSVDTVTVDNLGYGYIGINSATVNVGGDADSDASKDLRKGLATVLSVFREITVDSYYGERASVINYPISNTSWAAPQKTDEDYKVAYSTDVDGNAIYTSDMTADQKYQAALDACIGYLTAAGYTFENGVATAAPDGAKLSYELIIPADGNGDHPSFLLCSMASEYLAKIGITLTINDPADSNELWDKLDAGTQELWCAAWQATIDPDMYQIYYSTNSVENPSGSGSNHYHIADAELDELIMEARSSDDQSYRKTVYKECLDIILDWGVEIPVYQRMNCIIISSERVNLDTVTPDITTYWGWMNDIQLLEMNVD